jgi:hypothetical protein
MSNIENLSLIITDNNETIYENAQKIYDHALEIGQSQGYNEGYEEGNNVGYNNGYAASLTDFWDSTLNNGKRTNFVTAFAGYGWNDDTFRPIYDMHPSGTISGSAASMFNNCRITNLVDRLSYFGVKIDFSQAKSLKYCFANSTITHIPWVDVSSAETIDELARGCTKLVSIEGITLSETIVQNFTKSFENCKSLEHLRWDGGSIRTDLDLKLSTKLDRASIANTIKALYSYEKEEFNGNEISDIPTLIKLKNIPQNVEGYKALITNMYWIEHDPETGEDVIEEWQETIPINDNGEAAFSPSSYKSRVESVTNSNGESVEYTLHTVVQDYEPYEPTVTFSKQAVDKAFETSKGANNGSTSAAWISLRDSRYMATISLI